MRMLCISFAVALLAALSMPAHVFAQAEPAVIENSADTPISPVDEAAPVVPPETTKPKLSPEQQADAAALQTKNYPSLFFTYWQHEAILDAKNSRGHVRAPTQAELDALNKGEDELLIKKPDPGARELTLGGIVYEGADNWTIWLNGKRITPKALPKEVLDLQVFKNYIEVKWLDEFSSQIFPIRLRAHERFNLDMRIFLPG